MKYGLRIILLILLITTMMGGCNRMNGVSLKENIEKDENYVLNERQKEILKKEGVKKTEYKDLSDSVKDSIRNVEELLQFLEKKYNKTFIYQEYHPLDFMQDEMLIACVEGNPYDFVRVKRIWKDGKVIEIRDNYIGVVIKDEYEKFFADYWRLNEKIEAVVISDIFNTKDLTLPVKQSDYSENIISSNVTFIEDNPNYDEMMKRYKKWLKINSKVAANQLVVLKKGYLKEINMFNCDDFLDEEYIVKRYYLGFGEDIDEE